MTRKIIGNFRHTMIKRLFIAIRPNQATIEAIASFQKELQKELGFKGIRWVNPGLFHITLRFLGDTNIKQVPELVSSLRLVAETSDRFNLIFQGVDHFGSRGALRTIWAGTRDNSHLEKLFDRVVHCTEFLQLDQRPRYSPHLTLARGSERLTKQESAMIVQTLSAYKEIYFGETNITAFELSESTLTPSG
ncbi:MAG: RNA 2',3'-cyclic phosphodiesterase, partial [Chloroflexi bacterium]|nr:RNA 2',3'-cyclic phosphodiesterase [Chloroflexota bacterium]